MSQLRASIDPTVPVQLVRTFLIVAAKEGRTISEVAEAANAKLSTVSRHLLDLGDRNRKMEPGYGLVARVADQMELRVTRCALTPKGRLLAEELIQILED